MSHPSPVHASAVSLALIPTMRRLFAEFVPPSEQCEKAEIPKGSLPPISPLVAWRGSESAPQYVAKPAAASEMPAALSTSLEESMPHCSLCELNFSPCEQCWTAFMMLLTMLA